MRYGALKDTKDERDWLVCDFLAKDKPKLPEKIDWSDDLTPVRDQGDEPTCLAFAACAMKEYQEDSVERKRVIFSPRYLYTRIKQPNGGAYPRDAMAFLQSYGIPPEDCNPYIPQVPTSECPQAKELSWPNRIKGYARLNTIDDIKRSLYQNGVFVAAFYINQSWNSTKDGTVIGDGAVLGGHAVCIVGYDDIKNMLKFKNSWGLSWGDKGYGYISYVDAQKSLMDMWQAIDVPEKEEKPVVVKKSWWQRLIDLIFG